MHRIRSKIHQNALAAGALPQTPLGAQNAPQTPLPDRWGSAPDPAWGANDAPLDPLAAGGKCPQKFKKSIFSKIRPLYQILDPPLPSTKR